MVRESGDIIVKAIIWNIWLERNTRIFNDNFFNYIVVIIKTIYMVFSLIASIPEAKKVILEALATTVKRSLEFLRVQHPGSGDEWVEVEWCEQESVSC